MDPARPIEGPTDAQRDHDAQVDRLAQQMSLLLRRSRSFARTVAGQVHPDVDAGAYAILLVIAQAGPLRLVDLADEFGLDKSTMSRQVSALLRLGLLVRRPDPADGRAFLLELSPHGARRLDEVTDSRRQAWRGRLAHWSTAEIAGLADGLARLGAELPPSAAERPDPRRC
ncbi:MarR family winged helix-turn-helix transcriptional regulator [Pseudonocardia bannensis]|uniref:Winged helix-turn-helix transcriptional regulator n=1 Tax=Pseudonocardia bannensis TaxID=630973 RepID=A0A848DQI7_9PSEU|nr:MarR family winged helix-turn-helix transcriptional regulator [Pseudonocardia bannensis]NMH94769.1 winged helix-turn-helix transcriptional regulator [Pseudonocardia bannensis]